MLAARFALIMGKVLARLAHGQHFAHDQRLQRVADRGGGHGNVSLPGRRVQPR
jgi:hypothetical protein